MPRPLRPATPYNTRTYAESAQAHPLQLISCATRPRRAKRRWFTGTQGRGARGRRSAEQARKARTRGVRRWAERVVDGKSYPRDRDLSGAMRASSAWPPGLCESKLCTTLTLVHGTAPLKSHSLTPLAWPPRAGSAAAAAPHPAAPRALPELDPCTRFLSTTNVRGGRSTTGDATE